MQSKKAYELVTTGKAGVPGIPARDGFNGFLRDLPGDRACLSPSLCVCAKLDASVEASGPHDFAVRVQHRSSAVLNSVHRIPPRVRDDRERPLVGRDGTIRKVFCLGEEPIYFCDWAGQLFCPSGNYEPRLSIALKSARARWASKREVSEASPKPK